MGIGKYDSGEISGPIRSGLELLRERCVPGYESRKQQSSKDVLILHSDLADCFGRSMDSSSVPQSEAASPSRTVAITFTLTAVGTASGILSSTDNAGNNPHNSYLHRARLTKRSPLFTDRCCKAARDQLAVLLSRSSSLTFLHLA